MPIFLSALPVLAVIVALLAGMRSLHAAIIGVLLALAAIALAFPLSSAQVWGATQQWLPVLVEVLLIVGGGLLLSEVLRASGAQKALAQWILAQTGNGVGAVLLVVHGVTPFAESLTGFGIGITIGIPLLIHCGLPARKVAVIGLLGLCAVPWGSMGPGTLIAAKMANLPLDALGLASAYVSVIPFVVTGVVSAWLASDGNARANAVVQGIVSGLLLTAAVSFFNAAVGTAPAGALGALAMIVLHLWFGKRRARTTESADVQSARLEPIAQRGLAAYGVLLAGVLLVAVVIRVSGLPASSRYLASPALWLFVAAAFFCRGWPEKAALHKSFASWLQVAPVTGMFILLGVLLAVSGMATQLAHALAEGGRAYLFAAPFVGALGGFVTGSNTGANAMFAATQAEIATALGVSVLPFMAVHNVSAALLLMGSPGKIEMACHLAPAEALLHRRWIQTSVLLTDFCAVAMMAVINLFL